MPNLGLSELIVIFLILLLVFGASRLPALGEGLGRTLRGFKRGFEGGGAKPITTPPPSADKDAAKAKVEADEAELVDKR